MDIHNSSFTINSPNTGSGNDKIAFLESSKASEPSTTVSSDIAKSYLEDESENIADDASKTDFHLAGHQPRSRTRKQSDPFRVHNCKDRLPPLETEQQFRVAVTRCARGGDSMERNPSNGKFLKPGLGSAQNVPTLSPLIFEVKPIIISSSPVMKLHSSARAKGVGHRRTAAEVDAFFTRLSTPKYIRGKVSKGKRTGDHTEQMRCEATKGLSVNVIRTRSSSTARSGSRLPSAEK
uniref:Uncharacterized protein n=1 Tax=Setaria digitata TaxID=48799 RepID=A0A915PC60_9BILA